jgi:hypothetical protein
VLQKNRYAAVEFSKDQLEDAATACGEMMWGAEVLRKRCVTDRAAGAGLLPFKAGGGMTRIWGSPVLRRIPDVGSAPNRMRPIISRSGLRILWLGRGCLLNHAKYEPPVQVLIRLLYFNIIGASDLSRL